MTDIGELAKRMRAKGEWSSDKSWEGDPDSTEAADALEAQARDIAVLRAALTPLADMDYWIEPYHDAHDSIEQCNQLTVAEIRAARAALKGEQK